MLRVLYIEPDVNDIALLLAALKESTKHVALRYECNGLAALDCLRKQQIDLVVLSLRDTDLTWQETLHGIHAVRPDLDVLAVTGSGSPTLARDALRQAAEAVIPKPVHFTEFIDLAERIEAHARQHGREGGAA